MKISAKGIQNPLVTMVLSSFDYSTIALTLD
jgi:hypothetical protein